MLLKRGPYLQVPNGHGSINACGAELATVPLVSLEDRHLAGETTNTEGAESVVYLREKTNTMSEFKVWAF